MIHKCNISSTQQCYILQNSRVFFLKIVGPCLLEYTKIRTVLQSSNVLFMQGSRSFHRYFSPSVIVITFRVSARVYLKKKKNSPKSGLEILQQRYTFYHKESKILKLKELLNDKEGKEDTVLVTSKEV